MLRRSCAFTMIIAALAAGMSAIRWSGLTVCIFWKVNPDGRDRTEKLGCPREIATNGLPSDFL